MPIKNVKPTRRYVRPGYNMPGYNSPHPVFSARQNKYDRVEQDKVLNVIQAINVGIVCMAALAFALNYFTS